MLNSSSNILTKSLHTILTYKKNLKYMEMKKENDIKPSKHSKVFATEVISTYLIFAKQMHYLVRRNITLNFISQSFCFFSPISGLKLAMFSLFPLFYFIYQPLENRIKEKTEMTRGEEDLLVRDNGTVLRNNRIFHKCSVSKVGEPQIKYLFILNFELEIYSIFKLDYNRISTHLMPHNVFYLMKYIYCRNLLDRLTVSKADNQIWIKYIVHFSIFFRSPIQSIRIKLVSSFFPIFFLFIRHKVTGLFLLYSLTLAGFPLELVRNMIYKALWCHSFRHIITYFPSMNNLSTQWSPLASIIHRFYKYIIVSINQIHLSNPGQSQLTVQITYFSHHVLTNQMIGFSSEKPEFTVHISYSHQSEPMVQTLRSKIASVKAHTSKNTSPFNIKGGPLSPPTIQEGDTSLTHDPSREITHKSLHHPSISLFTLNHNQSVMVKIETLDCQLGDVQSKSQRGLQDHNIIPLLCPSP
ncbi:hypothetical protein VP01_1350g1 [Puccinia sorghi]|uniref:Uncharacterized protein n=1 Tax=Puccinia sorghi TaxID=27349 RepID=A0A0L6VMP5_9BASI|nr:hypothetical protein VP01_1350g1 [Puccinia sorghi]